MEEHTHSLSLSHTHTHTHTHACIHIQSTVTSSVTIDTNTLHCHTHQTLWLHSSSLTISACFTFRGNPSRRKPFLHSGVLNFSSIISPIMVSSTSYAHRGRGTAENRTEHTSNSTHTVWPYIQLTYIHVQTPFTTHFAVHTHPTTYTPLHTHTQC